jgi:hypothetical protein
MELPADSTCGKTIPPADDCQLRVRVTVHALLTVAVKDPGGVVELTVPCGTDIQGLIEILRERSPVFDPRASMALMDGAQVPLNRPLHDGEHVHLYPLFGGG